MHPRDELVQMGDAPKGKTKDKFTLKTEPAIMTPPTAPHIRCFGFNLWKNDDMVARIRRKQKAKKVFVVCVIQK